MGQCSTLPAEARASSSAASTKFDGGGNSSHHHRATESIPEHRHRLRDEGRKESLDFNKITPEMQSATDGVSSKSHHHSRKQPKYTVQMETVQPQGREPQRTARTSSIDDVDDEMDVDPRDEAPSTPPPPPENAVKTRAYRLNLDADNIRTPSSHRQQMFFGPFTEPPPCLTYSSSSDSSNEPSSTAVAVKTAQIFRGITISRDGTILSQNARATRSSRGNKNKRGEKSRQAAKIDKANDFVEEAVTSSKPSSADQPANMISLFVVGEYDDMKQLVRDGSKKLREAEGLPDEALFSINRLRTGSKQKQGVSSSSIRSPRQRNSAMQNPESMQLAATQQSAPPKLKSHPRDTRSSRRDERLRFHASCNDMLDPRSVGVGGGGVAGDGDWSHAWNIWNCGAGNVSPLQPSSPKDNVGASPFEGRESTGNQRDGGITKRTH